MFFEDVRLYVDVNIMVEWEREMDEHDNTDDESTMV